MAIAEHEFEKDRQTATATPGIVVDVDPEKEAKLANIIAQAESTPAKWMSSEELMHLTRVASAGLAENGYEPVV